MGFFMIKKWNIKVKKEISNKSLKQKPKTKVSGKTTKKTKTVKSSCKITKWNSKAIVWEKSSLDEDEKIDKKWLTAKQELFCQLYSTNMDYYGNWTQAYAMAYDKDLKDKNDNKIARMWASRMLTNDNILSRVRELQNSFLSDEMIDKELSFVALQRNDLGAKMRAINEYNKLKQRITDKSEVELKYDPLEYFKEINKRKKDDKWRSSE